MTDDGSPPAPSPSPSPGGPPPDRSSANREERGLRWAKIGGSAGIFAIPIGLLAWLSPNATPFPSADLQVHRVELSRVEDIRFTPDAIARDIGGSEAYDAKNTVIDFQLRNRGGVPVLIERVDVEVVKAAQLANCDSGSGPFSATVGYDLRLPTKGDVEGRTFSADTPFKVPPNDLDRLTLSVGPEDVGAWVFPWVYELDLALRTDSGSVDASRVALVNPSSYDEVVYYGLYAATLDELPCLRANRDTLTEAASAADVISPPLTELLNEHKVMISMFEQLEAGAGGRHPENAGQQDWPAVAALQSCDSRGLATSGTLVATGDVTNDGHPDAVVARSCATSSGPAPDVVTLYDGRTLEADPLAIGELSTEADAFNGNGGTVDNIVVAGNRIYMSSELPSSDLDTGKLVAVDIFEWREGSLARVFKRICSDGNWPRDCP